jgi:tetratricopeptide (TPR) repeat protein
MNHRRAGLVLIAFMIALCAAPTFAQVTGTVRGVCKDVQGKPIVGVVEWINADTGQKYTIKTNNKGEYFSLGITPGRYTVKLSKDGQQIYFFSSVGVEADEKVLDFDMAKEQAATAQGQGLSPEQAKQQQEQQAKASKETNTVKALNEKLLAAKQSSDAGNYDAAIATLTEATQMDATRDLIWGRLGEAYLNSAGKQTDAAEKTKRYGSASENYQKAIDLKQKGMDTDPKLKTPDATKVLAQYYNNLGQAAAKQGKTDDAVKAYNQAAQLDPAGSAQYYYNLGAIMTNANTSNDDKLRQAAVDAFNKSIAADPNRADSYYWKGVNLIGAATLKGDKMVAPDGTAEAFQKYLDLQPTGPHAEEAKAMMAGIGATVETNFGKKKGTPIKK